MAYPTDEYGIYNVPMTTYAVYGSGKVAKVELRVYEDGRHRVVRGKPKRIDDTVTQIFLIAQTRIRQATGG